MSKIPSDELRENIKQIVADKEKSAFVQTIDLQLKLRNYDPSKDKRFSGSVKVPYDTRPRYKVCILGDHSHCEKAKAAGIPFKTVDDLKNMNKNKKLVKKLAAGYHAFLASETLIKKIPSILGPGLNKAGKFPSVLSANDDLVSKVAELKQTIKFQLKKEINLGIPIGHTGLTEGELFTNITTALNFLVSLLKKNWQNIASVTIKSTQGKPHRVYP